MRFFITIIAVALLAGCSSNEQINSKDNVYSWGINTYNNLIKIYPPSFEAMSNAALVPEGFDFSKRNGNYDKNSNMQVSLDQADKEFLRNTGVISSIAKSCELNWIDKNFLPMMQWQRLHVSNSEKNGYQIYVVGFMHGFAQGRADDWVLENDVKCEQVRSILLGHLFADKF